MENVNLIDLTNLIEALLELAFLALVMIVIPWAKAKLSNEQEAKLLTIFEIAVMAAEKLYGAGKGDEKLKYVESYLAARGIKVDAMRLKAYVNAAIKKMEQSESNGVTIVENIETAVEVEAEEEEEEPQTEEAPEGA